MHSLEPENGFHVLLVRDTTSVPKVPKGAQRFVALKVDAAQVRSTVDTRID